MSLSIEQQGLSFVQYKVTSATQSNFSFYFPYIEPEDLTIYLNSTPLVATTDYTFINAQEIQLVVPAVLDDIITIRRFTKRDERYVDFQGGSQLKEETLDTDSNQLFYLSQEAIDVSNFGLGVNPLEFTVDARGSRIINVADGIDPTDGATIQQLDAVQTIATNAASSANASAIAAANAQAAAENAQDAADAVLGVAQSAVDTAEDALNVANSKTDQTDFDAHLADLANPHAVTKTQVGLGSADNTSDMDKPVSTAQAAAIAAAIAALVDSAPSTLDTLSELAAALGDDPNFATTVATALGLRLRVDTDSQGLSGIQKINAKTNIDLQNVDNTSDATKNSAVAILTNKTITGADIRTPVRSDVKQDTKANLVTYAITASNGQAVWATDEKKGYWVKDGLLEVMGSGSGSGGINYILNSDAETATTGWSTYADTAGTDPVDGTGGSPSSTFTRSISSPLRGSASFLWTKSAANRQGEGFSYDFTIDSADTTKVLQVSFDYKVASGTYVDDDMSVWVYDIAGNRMIQVAPSLLKNTGIPDKFGGEFQSGTGTTYRLIVHTRSTSASAYTLQFDNVSVGPQAKLYGSQFTDPVSVTYTLTNAGNATVSGTFSRRAGRGLFKGRISIGSSLPTGTITLNLPSGYSMSVFNEFKEGTVAGAAAGSNFTGLAFAASATSITFYGPTGSNSWNATVPATWANTNYLDFNISTDLTGFASSTIMSSDASTRVVTASVYGIPASWSANTPIIFPTVANDTHGAYNASTGMFLVPVTGFYEVKAFTVSNNSPYNTYVSRNASVTVGANAVNITYSSVNTINQVGGSAVIFANAGDFLDVRQSTASGTTGTSSASFTRISGPAQIAASETVAASYWLSTNFTASISIPINFNSKEYDTHGTVTTSPTAWRFTAPVAGTYDVLAYTPISASTEYLAIYKGGSKYKALAAISTSLTGSALGSIKLLAGEYIDLRPTGTPTVIGGTLSSNGSARVEIKKSGNY